MKVISILLACLPILASCSGEAEPAKQEIGKEVITSRNAIGFYSPDGGSTFTIEDSDQTSVNLGRRTYRLQTQDQSRYIHVQFAEKPAAVGQTVKTVFRCRGVSFLKDGETAMEVLRIHEGKVWLWSNDAGVVIPEF
jgi:hypothetical protein